MLTAIRNSDGVKVIGEMIDKDADARYTCTNPSCRKEVVHRKSLSRLHIGHFAHKAKTAYCPNSGETLEHIKTKLDICNYIRERWPKGLRLIEPEEWICGGTMRPDVYIETTRGTRIAIEVQASALKIDEIRRRTMNYHKNGVHVLWVLLFDFHRLFEKFSEQFSRESISSFSSSGYTDKWQPRGRVRITRWEQFIYWAYFKKLIFWDLGHEYSDGFIVMKLDRYVSDDQTFYSDGEEQYHPGRAAKTTNVVVQIVGNVPFNKFRSNVVSRAFTMPSLSYPIPARSLMVYEHEGSRRVVDIQLPAI